MLTILCTIVLMLFVVAIISICDKCNGTDYEVEDVMGVTMGALALGAFVGFVIAMGIGCVVANNPETKFVEINHSVTELVQLNMNNQISGSFFLGCGTIDEVPHYYAYLKNDDDLTLKTYDYRSCKINFTKDKPVVESYKYQIANETLNKWCIYSNKESIYYRFKIPEGSIVQSYDVNLK